MVKLLRALWIHYKVRKSSSGRDLLGWDIDVRYNIDELNIAVDERIHAYATDSINLEAVVMFMFDCFAMHTTKMDEKIGKYIDGLEE